MRNEEYIGILETDNAELRKENKQLKKEKDALYNALITTRTKYNNDKARYRRKTKRYRNILTELEEYLEKEWNITSKSPKGSFYEGYDTCMEEMKKDIQNKIQELRNKYEK